MQDLTFVDFDNSLAGYFSDFNRAWLEKYFYVEPIDEEMLANPGFFFIDRGGYIFFAKYGNEVAGTFALMRMEEGVFELSKMAVAEKYHGMKIGNGLLAFCLRKAKELNAKKIILYSNTKLENAIHLYRKYGFIEVPVGSSGYKRSNIKMELVLAHNFIKTEQPHEQDK
jgi:GNAT superfamily N-acetyltransferase